MGTRKRAARLAATALVAHTLAGCATTGTMARPNLSAIPGVSTLTAPSNWVPNVDPKGLNRARYEKDYAECKAFADADPSSNAAGGMKKKAVKWGLGGAALAAISGGAAVVPMVAATMAVGGGVQGKGEAEEHYRAAIKSCLTGRGYTVLN
jgi:hypothetical protein